MDAALKAELAGAAPTTFTAVSISLPGYTLRLVSGGVVTFGGNTYESEDATYGSLSMVETIEDGADGQATRCTITVLPPSSAAIAALAAATVQGSQVIVYQGAVTPSTGAVVGIEELFRGELDYPHHSVAEGAYFTALECGTEEGRLLERNDERKLSSAFHERIWPGELGLRNVTRLTRKIYWRANDPASTAIKGKWRGLLAEVAAR